MLLAALESVRIGKNCDLGLENAARGRRPRAAFSSPRPQFFPIRAETKTANNIFYLFAVNWLTSLFTQLCHWIGFRAVYKPFAKNLTSKRASKSNTIDVLKNRFISKLLYVSAFSSLVKVSKTVFPVWNFVQSLKLYYKTVFVDHCESLDWIRLFHRKLNSRQRRNSVSVLHSNSLKYSNDYRVKLDWNWLSFYLKLYR